MISKELLLKEFQKEAGKHWKVELFEREGFVRKVCKKCGKGFWTLQEKELCPAHDVYGFIGQPITKVRWDFLQGWKEFENFFKKNGHTLMKRYPVVSRWHPTLFFTIASIQDFIRIDASGLTFEYPYNPLIVPQMSLRFNDVQNVGVTGKHMTCFLMGGQHAFNDESGKGYWKDRCIELDFDFFTKVMKIPKEELVYVEDFWSMPDFSAFGPTIEAFSKGLELVNHVFMEFTATQTSYKELPIKVIDTGWGSERLLWFTQGTPTVYDVAFGDVVEKLKKATGIQYDESFFNRYAVFAGQLDIEEAADIKFARDWVAKQLKVSKEELEKNVAPMEALYAVADHARALAFAIADGALPSNVGGGYNLRIILRRALSFIEKFGWPLKLEDVAIWHAKYLKKIFPELLKSEKEIVEILEVEAGRYRETRERTKKIVESLKMRKLTTEDLQKLYESEGITPEQLGVEVPSDFYAKITAKHIGQKVVEEKPKINVQGLPPTKILYYEEPYIYEFQARVLKNFDENLAVLDQTAFYPTSGGQLHDTGTIDNVPVIDVFKVGDVVIHRLSGKVSEGKVVKCSVDRKRREILMRHHDAVHVINGVVRRILGRHVHQYGAEKDVDKARLDITHFKTLTSDEVEKIEKEANKIVEKGLRITKKILERSKAEQMYGFDIYAGGYVPSKQIRIVAIEGHDVEACGGTHGNNTKDVGWITIVKTKRIADGLLRIELKAGEVAENYLQEKAKILSEVAEKLGVREDEVPAAVKSLFEEWKKLRKQKRK
jgi:alanyl-tRNA synthetase